MTNKKQKNPPAGGEKSDLEDAVEEINKGLVRAQS